jgi:phosphoribosylformimino-5-aminoimidazole carboxamide ribotide isomerase
VVRAIKGRRTDYRPMVSRLCRGSNPADVVAALLDIFPFEVLYVADLDAILDQGNNLRTLEGIRRRFPGLAIWADTGIASSEELSAWQGLGLGQAVIGSESVTDPALAEAWDEQTILSLDFHGDRFIGPQALHADASLWPRRVIAMTLARVGADLGPDLERLDELISRSPGREIFAAGGVRHIEDLEAISSHGAAGVLLASALHDGRLDHSALAGWAGSAPG